MDKITSQNNTNTIDSDISNNLGSLKKVFDNEKQEYISNEEILLSVKQMIKLKNNNDVKKKKIINQNDYYKFFVNKFIKLHMNLPTIFNKVLDDDNFELNRLEEMLAMRKRVDDNKISNFDASVEISQKYTDEFVKKPLNID